MKRKLIFKVALWATVACVSIFGVLMAIVYIPEFKHYLPTHSKANELRVASYGGSYIHKLSIVLEYADGGSYAINIKNGIHAGEPQKYTLPPGLPDENVTVHISLDGYGVGEWDIDAMTFLHYHFNDLKRDGLLIYFSDSFSILMYVISGETQVCYAYNHNDEKWFIVANPPPIYHEPLGYMPGPDWTSGWEDNKWEYSEVMPLRHEIKGCRPVDRKDASPTQKKATAALHKKWPQRLRGGRPGQRLPQVRGDRLRPARPERVRHRCHADLRFLLLEPA